MLVFEDLVLSSLTGWMARVEMGIVKGFSRFEVSFNVQNGFVYDFFCFDHYIEESNLVL